MKFLFSELADLVNMFSALGNMDLISVLWHVGALAVIALFVFAVRATQPMVKDLKTMNPVVKLIRMLLPYLGILLIWLFFGINICFCRFYCCSCHSICFINTSNFSINSRIIRFSFFISAI